MEKYTFAVSEYFVQNDYVARLIDCLDKLPRNTFSSNLSSLLVFASLSNMKDRKYLFLKRLLGELELSFLSIPNLA
jgi:hypothetical protein